MDLKLGAAFLLVGVAALLAIANAQGYQCRTPNGQLGTCINVKQCFPLVSVLTSRSRQPSDDKFLRESQCGFEGPTPKVCCPSIGSYPAPNNFGQTGRPVQPNGNFGQNGNFEQGGYPGPQGDVSRLLPTECGQDLSNRIVGGNITDILEYPWMALLEYRKPSGKSTSCAGVLISKRYVLTAAHCVIGKGIQKSWSLESVRLGEYNTATDVDCIPEGDEGGQKCSNPPVTIRIEEKITHANYAPHSNDQRYDIALLRLSRDAPYTDYIRPICLPDNSNLASKMTVAGWGTTETRRASDVKLKVNVPLADFRQCSTVYQRYQVVLGEGQLCAGGERGIDSCRGDSGGPLMMREKERIPRWKVVGIVSFGPTPCGMEDVPGVYTKVYDFLPWIRSNIRA